MGAAALALAVEHGWPVFPLHVVQGGLCSCGQGTKCQSPGKHPRTFRGLHDATTDPDQIAAWWGQWPDANIGLATGAASGLYVVDCDGPDAESSLARYGEMPETLVSVTGNGRHLVFAYPREGLFKNTAKKLGPGLDTRGEGGYILAPPSVHPSGHVYRWASDPAETAIVEMPERLVAALERIAKGLPPIPVEAPLFQASAGAAPTGADEYTVDTPRRAADIPFLETIPDGTRNQTLAEYAGRLLAKGMGELETLQLVQALNREKCRPPLDRAEVERIVGSIAGAERRKQALAPREPEERPDVPSGRGLVRVGRDAFTVLAERNERPVVATPTMLPAWNRACRGDGGGVGLARGWHVTLAGSSGAGKSLCALNIAASALRNGDSAGIISLEMATQQLLARLLAIVSGINAQLLEPGRLYDAHAFKQAMDTFMELCEMTGASLYIADRPSGDARHVTDEMRRAAGEGVVLLIVDYMQRLEVAGAATLEETMRKASGAVQRVAFDENVTTIGLSQYNRSMSFNKDAPPNKHGLTGSSAIENDSDQVVLLDHSSQRRNGHLMDTNLIMDKNRHGPQPVVPVQWDYSTLRLTERVVTEGELIDEEADRHGIPTASPIGQRLRRMR